MVGIPFFLISLRLLVLLLFVLRLHGGKLLPSFGFNSVVSSLSRFTGGLDMQHINLTKVADNVARGCSPGMSTAEFCELSAETAAFMSTDHPDYSLLAGRIAMAGLHENTPDKFSSVVSMVAQHTDSNGRNDSFLSTEYMTFVEENKERIDASIDLSRDFTFDYFAYKTLEKSYLLRLNGSVVERPQHLFMRVALGIHLADRNLTAALETYDLLSKKMFIHASPTLFHAGFRNPQLSSCFLLCVDSDSISGIYSTLGKCAQISKSAGGIGLSVQNIRARGSFIRGTRGYSNGLVPMLRVFDATSKYVDQGGGRRPGACAVYVEPWHADIFEVLDIRKNSGKEEQRARDLFLGLWIPDLFMKRVEEDGLWPLLCPNECPGLADCWGEAFDRLLDKYVKEGRARQMIPARRLWRAILDSQIETGTPYVLFKDSCNAKSNQQHLGTIRSSNLCTEIIQFSSPKEIAVCNLASVILPSFVCKNSIGSGNRGFDHSKLKEVVKVMTRNLNKIIDVCSYPVSEAALSNMRHRPIGMGVQGLADVFSLLRLPFDSPEARKLNKEIFETIYFAGLEASCELAAEKGPYESYEGSPVSRGILQFDMWNVVPSNRWDWDGLRKRIRQFGLRNSLLVAPMPTASTAQITGSNECFEPYTSNLYTRRVRAGEFIVVNPHLLRDLVERGLWNEGVRNQLIRNGGSLADIPTISPDLKHRYKTVWEIKQKCLIDMAADRAPFVDQSQSLNAFIAKPDHKKLTAMHFYAWRAGLKTGMYYLRTKPASNPIQFTVDATEPQKDFDGPVCTSCCG